MNSDLSVVLSNALIDLIANGLAEEAGQVLGRGIAQALAEHQQPLHPYIGRRGRIIRSFHPAPGVEKFDGVIVMVGFDNNEDLGGAMFPAVTLRLDDGTHRTRHVDYLTLLDEAADA